MSSSSCWCLCHLVLGLSLNLGTWKSTCEWTLRGWVSLQCIVNATSCCLAGNHVVRMSHVSGWHNSFAACFCLYFLGKSLVVFLVGLWPFVGVFVVFLVMICEASCDHRRPCISFLINSFVSWGLSLRAWSAEPEEKKLMLWSETLSDWSHTGAFDFSRLCLYQHWNWERRGTHWIQFKLRKYCDSGD